MFVLFQIICSRVPQFSHRYFLLVGGSHYYDFHTLGIYEESLITGRLNRLCPPEIGVYLKPVIMIDLQTIIQILVEDSVNVWLL